MDCVEVYHEYISLHVGLHSVLDGVSRESDEGRHDSAS